MRKGQSLFNKCSWKKISPCNRMKAGPFLVSYTQINSEWSRDLRGRPEAVKRLEESTGGELHGNGTGNDFSDATLKAQATEAKTDKGNYIKKPSAHTESSQQSWTAGTGPCHQRALTPSRKSDTEQCSHSHLSDKAQPARRESRGGWGAHPSRAAAPREGRALPAETS